MHSSDVPELITDRRILDERAVTRYLEHLARNRRSAAGDLELDFAEAALRYSIHETIPARAWSEFGVPWRVLRRSGFELTAPPVAAQQRRATLH